MNDNYLFDEKRDRKNKRNRHNYLGKNKRDTTTTQTESELKIEKLCQKIVLTDPETSEDEFEQSPSIDSLFFNNTLDDDATLDEILLGKRKIIGGHFQFKHEKQWEEDEDEPLNEKFTLDTNAIAESLSQTAVNDLISTPTFALQNLTDEDDKCSEEKVKIDDISNDELIMSILGGVSDRQEEMQENDKIMVKRSLDKKEMEDQLENHGDIKIEESSNKNELEDWLDNILDD